MMRRFLAAFDDAPPALRAKIVAALALLIAVNLAAWVWALVAFRHYPLLLGTAFLAYGFGLRHAVDADHIAAIDNVTRKLMQDGKRPATVGFFFSLGHSTIVLGASLLIAATAAAMQPRFDAFKATGAPIGTGVSALFLFAIAIANLIVLRQVYAAYRRARHGERISETDLNVLLSRSGFLGRLFRPLFNLVRSSWQMYPIGFLFGLGFDTATEIGLLDISAVEAAKGLSIWSIMVFPALFTAGMALVDTSDGVLMLGAYGWAFRNPLRKLHYNVTITFVSALMALLIGGIEALGLIADRLGLEGGFWAVIGALNDNFGSLGYAIVALFALSWLVSALLYRRVASPCDEERLDAR
ncbi:MAG TPA: HoxN/HupN/NixA family nickel/cobalt transporter [Stellaceae bacterium]|nr:HoxN/HupN/NixA family nickel/cobalt transporter [Stellaceae bacterium]